MAALTRSLRLLDLFYGCGGWGRVFASRGWDVTGVDIKLPAPEFIPDDATVIEADVLAIDDAWIRERDFDLIVASSPCEQFSLWGMRHFHPKPRRPLKGIKLFRHTRTLCINSGRLWLMENVGAAQLFPTVGPAISHAGSFYLWGSAVPPILPQGIKKGMRLATGGIKGAQLSGTMSRRFRDMSPEEKRAVRKTDPMLSASSTSAARKEFTARVATIPAELAHAVASYVENLLRVDSVTAS